MMTLFQEMEFCGFTLRNRTVRSATWTGLAAEDGRCTDRLIDFYEQFAENEVGLIIAELTYIMPNGQAVPSQVGIANDEMLPALRQLTDRIHAADSKIAMQIAHCGAQTLLKLDPVWGPSDVANTAFECTPQAMKLDEIQKCVQAFADAADRVKRGGFDAVQIQAAHGWLISQFLSPQKNKRTDEYGGPIQNRARFLYDVYAAVRGKVGSEFPVIVKLNCQDFVENGMQEDDALLVTEQLESMGLNAIEISGGTPEAGSLSAARLNISQVTEEAYFASQVKKIKERLSIPVIIVGGIRSLTKAREILDTGVADLVSFARPLIREPGLIKRWKEVDPSKALCISCNNCYATATTSDGLHCAVEQAEKMKKLAQSKNSELISNERNFVSAIRKRLE
ncbi:MAG: NADH:flavin oxidoreductase [Deltaproteobacteria bacterium]|jgi:2,4-dienoyl-CoA reductase-like NADH-dependent reductase (Old Yellow Enzyme family)|nr:NADH:flavin oxidoreductase [Deltaproteobacteria bacterium]MBT4637199.1 NADH:flavin oxidoreductase [Deltaproteobacteria bacterium]